MLNSLPHACTAIDVLVGVRAATIVTMFVEAEAVVIEVWTNVVAAWLIDMVANKLADGCINGCADMPVGVSDVAIIVVGVAVIALEFAVPVSCAVDFMADTIVGVLSDALTGELTGVPICVVSGTGVDTLAEVNVDILAALMTVEIVISAPLEKPLCFC